MPLIHRKTTWKHQKIIKKDQEYTAKEEYVYNLKKNGKKESPELKFLPFLVRNVFNASTSLHEQPTKPQDTQISI